MSKRAESGFTLRREFKDLPDFHNHWELVCTVSRAKTVCDNLRGHKVIALDIETDATLDPRLGEIVLVQVSDGRKAFLLHASSLGVEAMISVLSPLLADTSVRKIIHHAPFDAGWIFYHYGIHVWPILDTRLLARRCGIPSGERSLAPLSQRFLGIPLPKTLATSFLAAGQVPDQAQCGYAARDVLVLHPLALALSAMLFDAECGADLVGTVAGMLDVLDGDAPLPERLP